MESPLTPGTGILIASVVLIAILNARFAFPARLLVGLRRYQVAGGLTPNQKPRSKRVKTKKDEGEGLGDAESLLLVPSTYRDVWDLPYFNVFDGLVCLAQLTVLVSALSAAYAWVTGSPAPGHPLALSLLCILGSILALTETELRARTTRGTDKAMAVAYGIGAFLATLAVQTRAPLWAPVQRQGAAVAAAQTLLQSAANATGWPMPAVSLAGLRLVLAGGCAALASLLLLPAVRFASAFKMQRAPPAWAAEYIPTGLLSQGALSVQFVAPLAASMLWGSMRADVLFDVTPAQARLIQGGALVAAAALFLLNIRVLLQRYLDTGLVAWHALKHPPPGGLTHPELRAELIRAKLALVEGLTGRAAVQVVAPAVLLLGMGLAQVHSAVVPTLSTLADANGLMDALLGFLAWWSGAAYFLFVASHMWVFDAPGV